MSVGEVLAPGVVLHAGDCLETMRAMIARGERVQSVVCDPPYHLTSIVKRFGAEGAAPAQHGSDGAFARASRGFMGKVWDGGDIAFRAETWRLCWELLPPGGHLAAFGGTRGFHRMTCAIEDAGFEIRDDLLDLFSTDELGRAFLASLSVEQAEMFERIVGQSGFGGLLAWVYGTGFPKSHDPGDAMDREWWDETELERGMCSHRAAYWNRWGTALKPGWEPIVLARKPLDGTVAENVLAHGTGAIHIDACRIGAEVRRAAYTSLAPCHGNALGAAGTAGTAELRRGTQGEVQTYVGRWPANVVHDGGAEVEAAFAAFGMDKGGCAPASGPSLRNSNVSVARGKFNGLQGGRDPAFYGDTGTASRFFYSAKATAADRAFSKHPTVKPIALMRWLVRMVTPPGGAVLDCFAGSGTTGAAALAEGFRAILCEREPDYQADIRRRFQGGPPPAQPEPEPDAPVAPIGGASGLFAWADGQA